MIRFFAYNVSFSGYWEYIGTWFADSHEAVMIMICKETGLCCDNIKVYSKHYKS